MPYKNDQYIKAENLLQNTDIFDHDAGYGYFRKKQYPFALRDPMKNLYAPVRDEILQYFADNQITWWGGSGPTSHTLSSQIACLNHLFPIRQDRDAVLAVARSVDPDVVEVEKILSDKANPGFIQFEAISGYDHLNETDKTPFQRGSHCTSIDALMLGRLKNGRRRVILIEWKYTESYGNKNKASGNKGAERKRRYAGLIDSSRQLSAVTHDIYYYEPFYQLMRQTLWAEQLIRCKDRETVQADCFRHIHVIPPANGDLLKKKYPCGGKEMEETWRGCISDNRLYTIVSPADFLSPLDSLRYKDLLCYLNLRYNSFD